MAKHFFTSESVTEGHPDKVCDQISDAILDNILEQDKNAHVACETTATTGMIHIMGEISTTCYSDVAQIARNVINEIGYDNADCCFDGSTGQWLRLAGELVRDDRREAKVDMLEHYPDLKGMYSADDDNTEVLYFKNATATIYSFSAAPKVVKF